MYSPRMTKQARTIWIDDKEWKQAQGKAKEMDLSLSQLIRMLLRSLYETKE